jgi:hypothetical protein
MTRRLVLWDLRGLPPAEQVCAACCYTDNGYCDCECHDPPVVL